MLKLYTYFRSSAAYRVRIALNLKNLPYEAIPVHLVKDGGQHLKEDYRRVNPAGAVPALADRELSLSQSLAARDALMEQPWQDDQQAQFEAMAQQSLSDQQAIEAADSLPFEEWRQRYLSPEGLLV